MIKIGITGGIGSGKSTVCRIFELLGVPVFYADAEAKKLLDTNVELAESIVKNFGYELRSLSGTIDKKKLGELVFHDKEKLEKLNSLVHPAVARHFESWCVQFKTEKYSIQEAAILFESGAYKQVEKVITVIASPELKISRAMQRDSVSREQIEQRMKYQLSDEEKIKRSQFIIYNDERQLVIPQVLNIHQQLMES